jgi:hypothetical protein
VSKSVEICRFFVCLIDFYRIGINCLEVVCELRLICLGSHSTIVASTLTHGAALWILMGRLILIRDRELVSNCVFMGQVDVFFGGLILKSVFLIMRLEIDLY